MEIKSLHKFPQPTIEQLLLGVSFYKAVKQQDPSQFELLLQYSRVVYFNPGEVVLQHGERDTWLYFLLKGRLLVYSDDSLQGEPVNVITPGEVFGDIAFLVGSARTATLVADPSCKQVAVFASDFSIFGPLASTHPVTLATKLIYYRNEVHNLRWKLEVYRSQHPAHAFANRHRQVRLYTGPKDTLEELQALHYQAQALARLLLEWNTEFSLLTRSDEPPVQALNSLDS